MGKKPNQKEILLKHTGIREQDLNLLFGSVEDLLEQIDIYQHKSEPIYVDMFDIYPKNDEVLEFDFQIQYNINSKRKENLYRKLDIVEDTSFTDIFDIFLECFCSNEYFLSMKTIWGLKNQILNCGEDVDLLFESASIMQHIIEYGDSYIEIANRIVDYLFEVKEVECIANLDIYLKFNEKQEPTMVIGWNNLRQFEQDPIVIHTEYSPLIEEEYMNSFYDDDDD